MKGGRGQAHAWAFGLCLVSSSWSLAAKVGGAAGLAAWTILGLAAAAALARGGAERLAMAVPRARAPWLVALALGALALGVLLAYPLANSGRFGAGSDSDDALVLGATELLAGRYPYSSRTYLGNPLSPLPGALLLAAPFVWLGNVALQNVFWLGLLGAALARALRDARPALLLLAVLLLLAPGVLLRIATGHDYTANSLYVLLALWLVERSGGRARSAAAALAALGLGVALASRPNFWLLLPLLFSRLQQQAGARAALRLCALALAGCAALVLPFYLHDPAGFSPLHTANKLGALSGVLPGAGAAIPALAGALALWLAAPRRNADLPAFLRNCALVQALPIACGVALESLGAGRVELGFATFAEFYLFFGALAFWLRRFGAPSAASSRSATARA